MSTHHLEHELAIDAPVATVWALTLDIPAWAEMSPTTMTRLEWLDGAPIRVGSRARVKQPAQRATMWTVTRLQTNELFEWTAKVFGVRMVAAHHLSPTATGCHNRLTIDMTGRGAKLLGRIAGKKILAAITLENEGFKQRAETLTRH